MKAMDSTPEQCDQMFQRILEKQRIDLYHIRLDYSIIWARGSARFTCNICAKTWVSKWAWIEADLSKQRIIQQYSQRCINCCKRYLRSGLSARLHETEAKPQFLQFRILLRNILERYKQLVRNNGRYGRPRRRNNSPVRSSREPHKPIYCKACDWGQGGRRCWKRGPKGSKEGRVVFNVDVVLS